MKKIIPGRYGLSTALCTALALTAMVAPQAQAQTAKDKEKTDKKADTKTTTEDSIQEVVVTGSRLRRTEFNATSPVQIITTDKAEFEGLADATRILQGTTIAATASQIDNNYTGYNVTGGPGVNTLSLRGLGSNRTLVLLNGHRVGPAGTRGSVGPVDLNTIPNSLVERYEILKDGASAVYGSDAIAGVVNIITKKNYAGGSARVYASVPEQGGGESFNFNLSQGMVSGKWHGSFGADYYTQKALRNSDRDYLACPQHRITDANGNRLDLVDPSTGDYKCYGLISDVLYNSSTGRYYIYDSSAVAGGGYGDLAGLKRVNGSTSTADARAARSITPQIDKEWLSKTVISPVTRKTLSLFGGYDFDNGSELYGELMHNVRESRQESWRQFYPTVNASNPYNVLKASGYPIILVPYNVDQQVIYTRALVGLRGDLPDFGVFKNWSYDIYGQISRSEGTYGYDFIYNDRVTATTGATLCNTAALTTATSCPTGGVNYFRQSTVETGVFTPEETAFLFGYETGTTTYTQKYVEATFAGDLWELPAGTMAATVGFMLRKESIDDTPGINAQNANYWGLTTAGRTVGSDSINEAYLELGIPVARSLPLIQKLDVTLSTRFSDYKSYGSNTTWKAGVNWQIVDSLRLRGSQGTSFRAPALYEQYLGNQVGYSSQSSIDPCYAYGTSTSISETVKANCKALGLAETYSASGYSSATIYTGGGKAAGLQPETSDNHTIGLIWTPKFANVNVALDFFETKINNQITTFGSYNILYECLNSVNMSSPYCSLFSRDTNSSSTTFGRITAVQNSYVNVAEQFMRGFDLTFSYAKAFPIGKFSLNSQHSFIRKWTYQLMNSTTPQNYLGYVGYPEYVGNVSMSLNRGTYTFGYSVNMVGKTSDRDYYGTNCYTGTLYGVSGTTYCYDMNTEFYANHTLSLRKKFDTFSITATVRNVLNEDPPAISGSYTSYRLGNAPLTSQYDQLGRTFTLAIERKW
ncbi:MAG: TonB-dependent receptor [Asticcacaulis sp.]